jgi:ribosome maturation protein Sdo1
MGAASKQDLENNFGTSRDDDVVIKILEQGKAETTDALRSHDFASKNMNKGTFIDNRGSGHSTSGV